MDMNYKQNFIIQTFFYYPKLRRIFVPHNLHYFCEELNDIFCMERGIIRDGNGSNWSHIRLRYVSLSPHLSPVLSEWGGFG